MSRTTEHQRDRDQLTRELSARLVAAREATGLNQTQLSAKADISRPQYAKYERGVFAPTLYTLTLIARALDLRVCELLEGL